MKTYKLKSHQQQILNEVKGMNLTRLHYLVIQQDEKQANLSLNELKKHIRKGIKDYTKRFLGIEYKYGCENDLIQYYCFFETSKEFFLSQHQNSIVDENIKMNLHFHLFISSNYGQIHIPQLVNDIINELLSQKNKLRAIKKIDYVNLDKLEDDFVLYHTKQMMYSYCSDLIIKNL